MFSMKDTGKRISVMRKNAGLTQMELANRLGISFQAVSNWERGVSMPDISNLGALAETLSVTVDEIIGDEKISGLLTRREPPENLTVEEFNAVSPLLSAEENRELLGRLDENTVADAERADLNIPALGLTEEELDRLARDVTERGGCGMLAVLSPYISKAAAEELCTEAYQRGNVGMFAILTKHLCEEKKRELLKMAISRGNVAFSSILISSLKKPEEKQEEEPDRCGE